MTATLTRPPDVLQAGPRRGRRRARVARPASPAVMTASRMLAAVALLAVWVLCFAVVLSGIAESRSQTQLYARFRLRLAGQVAPLGGRIRPGTPVALVDAPRGGLHGLVVVEGTGAAQLTAGPGHRADTPLPGQAGVSVLYGRSVTYGGPFHHVTRLRPRDPIVVTTGQGTASYRVDRVRHAGDPLPQPLAAGEGRLVLVTSTGGGWRRLGAPDRAVYVDATLVGATWPAPPGRPAVVPVAAQPMRGDTDALVPLVLWLQALVLAGAAAVYCWLRWGRWQTWLAGVPVVVAILWLATRTALMLAPNLV